MKSKSLFSAILVAFMMMANFANAQSVPKVTGIPSGLPTKALDVAKMAPELTSQISKIVGGLITSENSKTKSAISSFLGDYNNLIPLMKSNPAEFTKKLTALKTKFDNAMKLAVAAQKLAKFTGKGTAADALFALLK